MKNQRVILEVGGEGGSIQLLQINDYFLFTTDEGTLKDIDPTLTFAELQSQSDKFPTFAEAMINLLGRYRIFLLYPLGVDPEYKSQILPYYKAFNLHSGNVDNWNSGDWKKFLYC
jgi:hypothetical protein